MAIDPLAPYTAGRTGELGRSLTDRAKDVVNVGDFATGGVYPWNTVNDTAGINAAIAEANARSNNNEWPTLWFPGKAGVGGYRVTNKLTNLNGQVNVCMDAPIVVWAPDAGFNDFVWTIGDPSYRNPSVWMYLWMNTFGPLPDYTINPNFGGIQLINPTTCRVWFREMQAFHNPIRIKATGAGQYSTGNTYYLGFINGLRGLDLVADGANCWMISNTFNGGNFSHVGSGFNRSAIRMRSINGALGMHDLRFHGQDIEIGNEAGISSYAFETVGPAAFVADDLYLEGNGGFLKSDGGGYCQAQANLIEFANDRLITEPTFSGSMVIWREQAYGTNYNMGTGNRVIGQNDINTQHRNSSGTGVWTINKFIGSMLIDNTNGGALTLVAGSGVSLNDTVIAAGKIATLIGLSPGGTPVIVVEQP